MAGELRDRRDDLTALVFENDDGGLRVDVAVEICSQQVAILFADEVRCAIGPAAFAIVTDAVLGTHGPPYGDRLQQRRQLLGCGDELPHKIFSHRLQLGGGNLFRLHRQR